MILRMHGPDLYRRHALTKRFLQSKFKGVVGEPARAVRMNHMTTTRSLVSVVDDDESVRESLPDLLREFGFAVRAFSSAEELLAADCLEQTKCLILDIGMPGMTGPELQQELKRRDQNIPIIFITAQRDETICSLVLGDGCHGVPLQAI